MRGKRCLDIVEMVSWNVCCVTWTKTVVVPALDSASLKLFSEMTIVQRKDNAATVHKVAALSSEDFGTALDAASMRNMNMAEAAAAAWAVIAVATAEATAASICAVAAVKLMVELALAGRAILEGQVYSSSRRRQAKASLLLSVVRGVSARSNEHIICRNKCGAGGRPTSPLHRSFKPPPGSSSRASVHLRRSTVNNSDKWV